MIPFTLRLKPELNAKIESYSDRLGVTKSMFIVMCINSGIGNIVRASFPEEAISPEFMAKVTEELNKMGAGK